jgi:hypothetical protein
MSDFSFVLWSVLHTLDGLPGWRTWNGEVFASMRISSEPAAEAKTMSMRDGELVVRNGPFAETKDEVASYDII